MSIRSRTTVKWIAYTLMLALLLLFLRGACQAVQQLPIEHVDERKS